MTDVNVYITHTDFKTFDGKSYIDRVASAQRNKTIPELKTIFSQTVDGWEHKPDFDVKQEQTADSLTLTISPSGPYADIYSLVSLGSPAHTILPRSGKFLRFRTGYRAATQQYRINSQAKSRSGPYVSALSVNHPGFPGRKFAEQVKDLYYIIYFHDMQDAMHR